MTASTKKKTILVAGGAGFVGSHLCDVLLADGHRVICVDNFQTGSMDNVRALRNHPDFKLIHGDICEPIIVREQLDQIYNLACPASPPQYQAPRLLRRGQARGGNTLL